MLSYEHNHHELIIRIKREINYTNDSARYYKCAKKLIGQLLASQYLIDNKMTIDSFKKIDFYTFVDEIKIKLPDLTDEEVFFLAASIPPTFINHKIFLAKPDDDFLEILSDGITDFDLKTKLNKP